MENISVLQQKKNELEEKSNRLAYLKAIKNKTVQEETDPEKYTGTAGLPVEEKPKSVTVDYLGATLCALGLAGPIYALIEAGHYGWSSAKSLHPLDLRA